MKHLHSIFILLFYWFLYWYFYDNKCGRGSSSSFRRNSYCCLCCRSIGSQSRSSFSKEKYLQSKKIMCWSVTMCFMLNSIWLITVLLSLYLLLLCFGHHNYCKWLLILFVTRFQALIHPSQSAALLILVLMRNFWAVYENQSTLNLHQFKHRCVCCFSSVFLSCIFSYLFGYFSAVFLSRFFFSNWDWVKMAGKKLLWLTDFGSVLYRCVYFPSKHDHLCGLVVRCPPWVQGGWGIWG